MRNVKGIISVECMESGEKTLKSGIVLPDDKNKFQDHSIGKVIAIGKTKYVAGVEVPMDIKEGNIVCFTKAHPLVGKFKLKNKTYYSMPEERIHCYWSNLKEYEGEI